MNEASIARWALVVAVLAFALTGCAAPAAEEEAPAEPVIDLVAEEEAAKQVNRDWLDFYRARDAEGIGELFVEDGWILQAEDGVTEGRAAITARTRDGMAENPDSVDDWGVKGFWIADSGDLAVERGWWTADEDGDGEGEETRGEYITVLVKVNDQWKVLADAGSPEGGLESDD